MPASGRYSFLFLAVFVLVFLSSCFGGSDDGQYDVTDLFRNKSNIYEEVVRNDDGSITYYGQKWGGLSAQFVSQAGPADWSDYASIVFEFDKPTKVSTQVEVNGKLISWAKEGTTRLEADFSGKDVSAIRNISLRPWDSTTIVINRIYLTDAMPMKYSTSIWEGKCVMGNWTGGFTVGAEKFEKAEEGDELEIIYDSDVSNPTITYWQLKTVYDQQDVPLQGNANELNDWGCILVSHELHNYRVTLTKRDVDELRKYGLYVNGYYTIVTQCNLLQ